MFRAAERREVALELAHLRPVDELAVAHNARDRIVDARAEPAALRRDIDERKGSLHARMLVHSRSKRDYIATLRGLRCGATSPGRQRIATSRLATPSAPVTAGGSPSRI